MENPDRVRIEIELPPAGDPKLHEIAADRAAKATALLRKLGLDTAGFYWSAAQGEYYVSFGAAHGYETLDKGGYWFNLDALAEA